jgi:hypothetical protein
MRHLASTLADPAISSASNFLVLIVAGHSDEQTLIGVSAGLTVYIFCLGFSRIYFGDLQLMLAPQRMVMRHWDAQIRRACLVLSVAIGAIGGALVFALCGDASYGVAFAVCTPGLLLLDAMRYGAFATAKPRIALELDSMWLILFVAVWLLVRPTGALLWLAWAGSPTLVVMPYMIMERSAGRRIIGRSASSYVKGNWSLARPLFGDFAVTNLTITASQLLLPVVAVASALPGLRALVAAYGPVSILFAGASAYLLPRLASRNGEPPRGGLPLATMMLCAAAGLWTATIALLPYEVGLAVFGEAWPEAAGLVVPFGLAMVASIAVQGGYLDLKRRRRTGALFRVRLVTGPPVLIFSTVGAAVADLDGYVYGLLFANVLVAAVPWLASSRANAESAPVLQVPDDDVI